MKFTVAVGTYEGNLIGWESDAEDASGMTLRLAYAFNAHGASVKALALDEAAGKTLVSASGDESMKVYNLATHREVGSLLEHKDTVTALQFHGTTHVLSGARDGVICIWRTSDWACLASMRGHKGGVNSLAVHPTGRMALSVSADRTLRLWDLTKAKPAHCTNLPGEGIRVHWDGDGLMYAILYDGAVLEYDGATGALKSSWKAPPGVRLLDMCYIAASASSAAAHRDSTSVIAIGCEGGDLRVWSPAGKWCRAILTGHSKRVRCVAAVDAVGPAAAPARSAAAAAAAAGPSGSTAAPLSSSSAAASAPAGDSLTSEAPTTRGIDGVTSLGAAAKARTQLSSSGPFLATVDSDCVVKLWDVGALIGGGVDLAKGKGLHEEEVRIEGLVPVATLSAGSGARATALVASHSTHPTHQSIALDAEGTAGVAGGKGKPAAAPAAKPADLGGKKQKKQEKMRGAGGAAEEGGQLGASSSSSSKKARVRFQG